MVRVRMHDDSNLRNMAIFALIASPTSFFPITRWNFHFDTLVSTFLLRALRFHHITSHLYAF